MALIRVMTAAIRKSSLMACTNACRLMCDRMMSPEEAIERATDHFYGRDRVDGGKSALNVRVGGGEA